LASLLIFTKAAARDNGRRCYEHVHEVLGVGRFEGGCVSL
jgi:hypothetical protein